MRHLPDLDAEAKDRNIRLRNDSNGLPPPTGLGYLNEHNAPCRHASRHASQTAGVVERSFRQAERDMATERVHFLQAIPAPALRASFNRAARCPNVAELAYLLAQRRGFALFHEPQNWLAALQAVNARPAGAPSWPSSLPPRAP